MSDEAIDRAARSLVNGEPRAGFRGVVLARIEDDGPRRRRAVWMMIRASAALAIVGALLFRTGPFDSAPDRRADAAPTVAVGGDPAASGGPGARATDGAPVEPAPIISAAAAPQPTDVGPRPGLLVTRMQAPDEFVSIETAPLTVPGIDIVELVALESLTVDEISIESIQLEALGQ